MALHEVTGPHPIGLGLNRTKSWLFTTWKSPLCLVAFKWDMGFSKFYSSFPALGAMRHWVLQILDLQASTIMVTLFITDQSINQSVTFGSVFLRKCLLHHPTSSSFFPWGLQFLYFHVMHIRVPPGFPIFRLKFII